MSTWNFRVLAFEYINREESGIILKICEVYYKDDIPVSYKELHSLSAENIKDITWMLEKMKDAVKKPILWGDSQFPNEYKIEES